MVWLCFAIMPSATKLTILGSSILFFQVLSAIAFGNMFVINRRDTAQNQWDAFTIPSSLCNQRSTTSGLCRLYQADSQLDRRCSCKCSLENSTFIFYQNKWRCLSDSEVKQFQGKPGDGKIEFMIILNFVFFLV